MVGTVKLESPGILSFIFPSLTYKKYISKNVVGIVGEPKYIKTEKAVDLNLQWDDGEIEKERFYIKHDLYMMNYPKYNTICMGIEDVKLVTPTDNNHLT